MRECNANHAVVVRSLALPFAECNVRHSAIDLSVSYPALFERGFNVRHSTSESSVSYLALLLHPKRECIVAMSTFFFPLTLPPLLPRF